MLSKANIKVKPNKKKSKYEQVVNYVMLYDYGNEAEDITGGWSVDGATIKSFNNNSMSRSGTSEKLTNCLHLSQSGVSGTFKFVAMSTNNKVDMKDFITGFIRYNSQKVVSGNSIARIYFSPQQNVGDVNKNNTHYWIAYSDIMQTNIGSYGSILTLNESDSDIDTIEQMNTSYYIIPSINFGSSSDGKFDVSIYNMTFFKHDNLTKLTQIIETPASSVETLLENSSILLNNEEAVEYMIYNCTGDFMVKAITSSTFLTALNNSPYKTLVYSNEHWAKFLGMVA